MPKPRSKPTARPSQPSTGSGTPFVLKKTALFVSLILPLSACSEMPALVLPPPANLTVECPPVPPFEGSTSDDLISAHIEVIGLYRDCSVRHNALVDGL